MVNGNVLGDYWIYSITSEGGSNFKDRQVLKRLGVCQRPSSPPENFVVEQKSKSSQTTVSSTTALRLRGLSRPSSPTSPSQNWGLSPLHPCHRPPPKSPFVPLTRKRKHAQAKPSECSPNTRRHSGTNNPFNPNLRCGTRLR